MSFDYLLIIVLLISAIISLINEKKSEKEKIIPNWIIVFLIIIVAIIQGYNIYQEEQMEKYSAGTGSLALSESEFQNLTYIIGSNKISGVQNRTLFGRDGVYDLFCDKEIISTRIVEGELKVSAFLYDENDNVIARIVSNEWTVNPKFMWDKNFDTEGFEIVDDKLNALLQIEKHGNVVELRGDFYCNGIRFFIDDGGIMTNPKEGLTIKPMFRYPAVKYPGERDLH